MRKMAGGNVFISMLRHSGAGRNPDENNDSRKAGQLILSLRGVFCLAGFRPAPE
jgi:hypothetical protein